MKEYNIAKPLEFIEKFRSIAAMAPLQQNIYLSHFKYNYCDRSVQITHASYGSINDSGYCIFCSVLTELHRSCVYMSCLKQSDFGEEKKEDILSSVHLRTGSISIPLSFFNHLCLLLLLLFILFTLYPRLCLHARYSHLYIPSFHLIIIKHQKHQKIIKIMTS